MIDENTKLSFGKHRGTPLKNCPPEYLKWMVKTMADGDFHEWAIAAAKVQETLGSEKAVADSLEQQADDFLRSRGIDPKRL